MSETKELEKCSHENKLIYDTESRTFHRKNDFYKEIISYTIVTFFYCPDCNKNEIINIQQDEINKN